MGLVLIGCIYTIPILHVWLGLDRASSYYLVSSILELARVTLLVHVFTFTLTEHLYK
jgi:hypothetical protein